MIATLGESELLLPGLLTSGLAANDRVKYLLTLVQSARAAADGVADPGTLREERLACGVEDSRLDRVVGESVREPDGRYRIPGAARLSRWAIDEVRAMLSPLHAAVSPEARGLEQRVEAISAGLSIDGDLMSADDVARLTRGPGHAADSLHLVVMDAHRELNKLQAEIATESIDGAHVHDLTESDRARVRAFMRGVHATERLKLDHPGLGTIATRSGPALVIQNDLGTTDAHIVVIRVTGRVVTLTYTDVHLARLVFFQDLLDSFPRGVAGHTLAERPVHGGWPVPPGHGPFEAPADADVDRFLEHLGSRLVFIIDWNRARKRLRRLVGRRVAIRLLRWAAEHEYGHIAFLRAGADGLVYDALEFAGGRVARAGESLEEVLGADAAEAYLRSVLRICSEGLLAGKMVSLVQDEVRAELTGYLRSARQEIHELALRHAELCVEIAEAARDGLEQAIAGAIERREPRRRAPRKRSTMPTHS